LKELRYQLKYSKTENHRKLLKDRIARLAGKMAFIRLGGGGSQVEMLEMRDKIIDALNATKLALKHVY